MNLLSNNMLNNLVTIKTAAMERGSLFKPGVIEAVVLSRSPLMTDGKVVQDQYQLSLQVKNPPQDKQPANTPQNTNPNANSNNQAAIKQAIIEVISKQPLVSGSKVQLQISADNTAKIISATDQNGKLILGINNLTGEANKNTQQTTTATAPISKPVIDRSTNAPIINNTTSHVATQANKPPPSPQTRIDNAMRQALPIQQPLKLIAPLLQQLSQTHNTELPKTITQQIKTLLATIPTQQQAQDPKALKRALLNSGTFFESKLNRLVTDHQNRQTQQSKLSPEQRNQLPPIENLIKRDAAIINSDSKASTQKLIQQIEHALGKPLSRNQPGKTTTATDDTHSKPLIDPTLIKTLEQTIAAKPQATATASKENLDIVLQQLGRQLLASLAKTQLNQLDTLNQRPQATNEPTTNSWSLEIPIMNGKQVDNMELKIQQEEASEKDTKATKQWRVMLDFDLHKLGKMSVELVIINKSVSATIWSELEQAHREVEKEINTFQQGLEKIGVNVTKVDCKIGIPEKRPMSLQPLVDIRT